jgi:hypothetical protein
MRRPSIFSCFLLLVLFFLTALSESGAASLVEKKTADGIPYITGGVGLEEREEMMQMPRAYNLKLVFAVPEGNYLADVEVVISKSKGVPPLLKAMTEGPWLLVQLPEGEYEISANTCGEKKSQTVRVGESLRTVIFRWKAP